MRARVTLWISLGLNILMLVVLTRAFNLAHQEGPVLSRLPRLIAPQPIVKTNVVVRRQNFTWDEIESRDYPTYIANLRAIACPGDTIRDIIIADVNHLYAERRATEVVTADQQWWRSDAETNLLQAAFAKQNALEDERRALLTQLLGAGWEQTANPSLASFGGFNLSGPAFASLSAEARDTVQEVHNRAKTRLREYSLKQQQAGRAPEPRELARIQQQTREDLAKVLTSDQMEEYLLRYSPLAGGMRNELRGYDISADEFRNIFRARDSFDSQLQLLAGLNDPASQKRREELERQRELAVQKAFPTEKYELYKLSQDPLFQQAQTAARQSGASPETVLGLYEINQAIQQEVQRIRNDKSLEPEDLEKALLEIEAAQRKSVRQILGDTAYERYLELNKRN